MSNSESFLWCFVRLSEKEKQVCSLQDELAELRDSLELHRKKNNVGFLQRWPGLNYHWQICSVMRNHPPFLVCYHKTFPLSQGCLNPYSPAVHCHLVSPVLLFDFRQLHIFFLFSSGMFSRKECVCNRIIHICFALNNLHWALHKRASSPLLTCSPLTGTVSASLFVLVGDSEH